ncbi:MAG: DUF1854 domain-containing protein [Armatimonadetes bacterium]|nr:DUF1854 domain-containing protein [Armatimonadota bacterium]
MSDTLHTTPRPNYLVLLDPERVRLVKDRPGWLLFSMDGEVDDPIRVKPVRTFPLTDPEHYISLLDEEEDEVGVIEDPRKLESKSRRVLRSLLEHTYFLPIIQKINRIIEDYGVYRWEVETNKGEKTFEVRGRDDVHFVANGHIIIRDIDGNRYHVPSLGRLDADSRTMMDILL